MFEAPEIIKNIPDIKQIYDINEMQGDTLDQTVEQIDSDMNIDEMDASTVERWETILKIVPARSDTLDVRRFRIKTKITDSMPYTYRALERKLDDMCAGAYDIVIDRINQSIKVNLGLASQKKINDVMNMLEEMVPLDMIIDTSVLYNAHGYLAQYPHCILAQFTHKELREMELEKQLSRNISAVEGQTVKVLEGYKVEQINQFGFRKESTDAENNTRI
nr:MAG TPA: tail protein [Caudoviricetes sp.]